MHRSSPDKTPLRRFTQLVLCHGLPLLLVAGGHRWHVAPGLGTSHSGRVLACYNGDESIWMDSMDARNPLYLMVETI